MKNINNLRIGQEVQYNGISFNVMSIWHPSPQPKPELDKKWLVELECGFVPFDDVIINEDIIGKFENALDTELGNLSLDSPHYLYNEGYLDGFESGARWWFNLKNEK